MSSNGISTLATKELKQIDKLNLAATKRATTGRPSTLDITLLPSVYTGNEVTVQLHPNGLVEGRPWTSGPPTPTYAVNFRSVFGEGEVGDIITTCNEGVYIWFDMTGTNVPNDPSAYLQFSGANITNEDGSWWGDGPMNLVDPIPYNFSGNSTNGAYIYIAPDNLTEGNETLTLAWIVNGTTVATASITLVDTSTTPEPTYSFDSIPSSINEGSSGTFNIVTTNVNDGITLYWTIATNSGDFGTTSGSFIITSNAGSFTVTPTADNSINEGAETFTVALRTGSITGTVVATSSTVTINDTSFLPPLESSVQLITNSDFSAGTTGWTASAGFGTYSFTASNQVALYNGELYFTYILRTVSRTIDVSSVIDNAVSLKATVNIRHREKNDAATYTQIDKYTFTVTFKNSSGATVTTKTTGLSNAPQNSTDIDLTLDRSEIPATFGTITSALISVSGQDTGGWNGNHGPIVKYIKLVAS